MAASEDSQTFYLAGMEQRAVAFILDVVLLVSFLAILFVFGGIQAIVRSDSGNEDLSDSVIVTWIAIILSWFVLVPLYYIAFWVWRGQTVGKIAVNIGVMRTNGEPLSLGTAVLRFVAFIASMAPLFAGFFVAFFQNDRRALHDLIADTVVIDLS